MALIRQRRQLNLRLPLPEPSECRPCFTVPLPPTIAITNNSSFSAISTADLENLQVLGHGNSGTVYKVNHKRTSTTYALKLVHSHSNDPGPILSFQRPKGRDCNDPTVCRQLFREMEILRHTDSPHVVRCHAIFEKPSGDIGILMDTWTPAPSRPCLKPKAPSPSPILPTSPAINMEVKIADFGVSKILCRTSDACNSYVGTCAYMSPERFDPDTYGGNYSGYAGDIWSLGLTLVELYMGHFPLLPPGQKPDWATLMCAICFGEPPSLPEGVSEEFRSFMECCLQKESEKRWTAAQLLTHPFVSKDPSISVS
ncbi:unnamed protein product [Prunus armeniaca]|uniref:Protein kinase domain-containing protein n=1 Tax=Prunus armeniaca TaxID=36596 RepID=A0A6J5TG52_PRUAR|nr:unnamed protein product [Prunus armeniaca]